jgi:hypothetical protein
MPGCVEVRIAPDVVLAHRLIGRLVEKARESVDEARAAGGRPVPPVRHLYAVAIAQRDITRPGIDDYGHLAPLLPAEVDDLVHVLGRELETTPAPFRHQFRIHGPERTFAPRGPG